MIEWTIEEMADEVINLIPEKSTINLGIGLPTVVAERSPDKKCFVIHSENGVLGVKGRPKKKDMSPTLINAGKETISVHKGASFFDSSLSFGMIRGGHVDVSILGAMQVDVTGSLANWAIPGQKITGMGGAMDLVNGPRIVIAMCYHQNKKGISKLVDKCTLPLTGRNVINYVVTNNGVFTPDPVLKKFKVIKLSDEKVLSSLEQEIYSYK
jgi:3-oxoacid CoA-transferase subunit B